GPYLIAVPFYNGMGCSQLVRFFGEKRGVNAAVYHFRSTFACNLPYFIAAQRVAGMNTDAHHIAVVDHIRVQPDQGFINNVGIAHFGWSGRRQHVKPTGRDNTGSKGRIARVDQVDLQQGPLEWRIMTLEWKNGA